MSASFTPRKEFIRIRIPAPDSFALLALSSSDFIRLYSFPASTIDALRHLFEQLSIILSSREDSSQGLHEFTLDGKPWANAKAVFTEKLLLDILAIIYQCGYNYLSTIDYGRGNDDRLVIVFSKPGTPQFLTSQATNLSPPSMSTNPTLNVKEKVQRVPFALSFASATLMRVIAPPLYLTPAILQAVRASWPRGVVSEKKVGDNSFEFRLKGRKWFQQDTFASDFLRHILALLASLDSYSFSLLASISLTNRSRVKDLWIFTGLVPEDSLPVETPAAIPNVERPPLQGSPTEANHLINAPQQHTVSESKPHLPYHQHSRATTDSPQRPHYTVSQSPQPHRLRKPVPRSQIPTSVPKDLDIPVQHRQVLRAPMPSTISSGVENMTGVGAVGLKQDVLLTSPPPEMPPLKVGRPAAHGPSDLQLGSDRVATSPLLTSTPPKEIPQSNAKDGKLIPSTTPIAWTSSYKKVMKLEQENPSGPMFPGGWHSSPVDEKFKGKTQLSTSLSEEKSTASIPIHENDCRTTEAPTVTMPDMSLKKNEAALVEIIASTSHVPSTPGHHKPRMKESQTSSGNGGQGWVLVNVEGSDTAIPVSGSESTGPSTGTTSHLHELKSPNSLFSPSFTPPSTSKSPAAKAIVTMDAMDSKQKKRSTMQSKGGSTGIKQFFSLNKKNLKKASGEDKQDTETETLAPRSVPRSVLRSRLRLGGGKATV